MILLEKERMKNYYVSGLCDGSRIDDIFLIHNKSLGYTQDGSPFVRMRLGDRTGTIDAIKWDASEAACDAISSDEFIRVRGIVTTYNGRLQIKVDTFRPYNDRIDPTDFLPRSEKDIDEMLAEFKKIIDSVEHPQLKALLDHFFKDQEFLSRFSTAPAAQKIHHAYIGGLLEHTLSAAKLCEFGASHFPGVDRDLLITGAVLHDIGKVEEFCWDKSIRYSDNGHLIGHVVIGAQMVKEAADTIEGFHPLLKSVMVHIILSHHGEKEWGAAKRPKVIEAIILHVLEDLDAKVNTFRQAVGKDAPASESDLWTERNWVFDRPLLKGLPSEIMNPSADAQSIDELLEPDYNPFADE